MKNLKEFGEIYLLPVVKFVKLVTGWQLAWVWGFGIPLGTGQPLWFCIFCGLSTTMLGWYIWRDHEE